MIWKSELQVRSDAAYSQITSAFAVLGYMTTPSLLLYIFSCDSACLIDDSIVIISSDRGS